MKNKDSILNNKLWIPVLIVFTVIFFIFAYRWGNVAIKDQAVFLLSQIAFVFIPGMAVVLLVNPPENKLILAIMSYLAGYAFNIVLFFLFSALGLVEHLTICMTIVAVLCLVYIIKKRTLLLAMKTDHSGAWSVTILLIIFLTSILFQAVANYNTPDFTGNAVTYIYQDLAWNVGNTTAISNGLPIMDIHVEGLSLGYHYFVNVFAAIYKNILGVSTYLVYMKLLPVAQVFIFVGGFYLLFSTLTKNKWMLLFMIGTSILCSLMILAHMFWYSYVTAFGMGLSLAAAYFLLRYIKNMDTAKFYNRDFIMFLILLAAVTGSKIMYAAPCLAGFSVLAVVNIIRRKNVKNVIMALAMMVALFGAVYLFTSFGIYGYNDFQIGFAQLIWGNQTYIDMLAQYPGVSVTLIRLFVYATYTLEHFIALPAAVILLIVWLIRSKGREYHLKVFLLAALISCYTALTILVQNGLSQMMFLNAVLPFSLYALFYAGRYIPKSETNKKVKPRYLVLYLVLMGYITVYCVADAALSLTPLANQSETLRNDVSSVSAQNVLYKDEYEGMVWLRDNTAKNTVFAADRFYNDDVLHARYFNYTAISERQSYLEGYEYIYTYDKDFGRLVTDRVAVMEGVYNNDPESLAALCGEGVSYLACSRRVHPDFELNEAYGKIVFENDGITIYKLECPG